MFFSNGNNFRGRSSSISVHMWPEGPHMNTYEWKSGSITHDKSVYTWNQ